MIQGAKDTFFRLVSTMGKAALATNFPNDFEYYMVALELLTYEGKTIDFFSFPVMPSQIRVSKPSSVNIKKTFGGVVSSSTEDFIPFEINLNGNFGRNFKFISTTGDLVDTKAIGYSINSGVYKRKGNIIDKSIKNSIFNFSVKNGYGCMKILEAIVEKSTGTIDGNRNILLFYNMALGQYNIVEPISLNQDQSEDQNMLWRYSLQMTAVSDMANLSTGELDKVVTKGLTQKTINSAITAIRTYL